MDRRVKNERECHWEVQLRMNQPPPRKEMGVLLHSGSTQMAVESLNQVGHSHITKRNPALATVRQKWSTTGPCGKEPKGRLGLRKGGCNNTVRSLGLTASGLLKSVLFRGRLEADTQYAHKQQKLYTHFRRQRRKKTLDGSEPFRRRLCFMAFGIP